ncbi:protein chromatin remodeling 20 [Phtheirospermum japonicum]|uniref:Protein chromatin remodeling 20 n=1 Tax=Phtheirospermum japonicum TaxID=374723 RepID=A0A830C1U5_9LAMI|nr:protein chromatin remodeling 20 [Phtheirospermum japonicum]
MDAAEEKLKNEDTAWHAENDYSIESDNEYEYEEEESLAQEPLTEEEIEELIAELLEVESKAFDAQEALEDESLSKVEADVRQEVSQSLSGDELEKAVAEEMVAFKEEWEDELDELETESAHLLEQLDGAGIALSYLYKWIEGQVPNGCCTEAWKKRAHWVGAKMPIDATESVACAEKYLDVHRPVRRRHGKVLEAGASGFLGKKLTTCEQSVANESTEANWDSFSKMCSERSSLEDMKIAFGSEHWASVYLASTPQQAAELGLNFPGVNEVEEIDDVDGVSNDLFFANAIANERSLSLTEEQCRNFRKVKEEDDANDDLKLHVRMIRRRRKMRHKEGTICGELSSVDEDVSKSEVVVVSSSDESEVVVVSSSDSDSDADVTVITSTQSRKRKIRRILDDTELGEETKKKIAIEKERQERLKSLEASSIDNSMISSLISNDGAGFEVLGNSSSGDIINLAREEGEEAVRVPQSISMKLKLHQFVSQVQIAGIRFMWENIIQSVRKVRSGDKGLGCILAHTMGLGKTFQVIAFLYTVMRSVDLGLKTALVVTPVSVLHNWRTEFTKWRPCELKPLHIFMLDDVPREKRVELLTKWKANGGVLLIGYAAFRNLSLGKYVKDRDVANEISCLLQDGPDILVCDEAHIIKNIKGDTTQALKQVKCQRRIAFQNPIENGQHANSTLQDVKIMNQRSHILYEQLKGFVQRKDTSVVKNDLPPKTIWNHPGILQLMKENKDTAKLEDVQSCLADENSGDENVDSNVISGEKLVNTHIKNDDSFLCADWWKDLLQENNYKEADCSGKMVLLLDILTMCSDMGDKALVFSQSLSTLDLIEFYLSKMPRPSKNGKCWKKGKDWYRLDGKTESSERQKLVERFNEPLNKRVKCTLISTRAGALGINLYSANRVIIVDGSWNPTYDLQAIYRVWRYGQTKHVTKEGLAARVVDKQQVHRTMSKEEMLHLFDFGDDENGDTMHELGQDQEDAAKRKITGPVENSSDKLFRSLISKHHPSYHEHETLLQENEDEKLSKEEQDLAWEVYHKTLNWVEAPRVLDQPKMSVNPSSLRPQQKFVAKPVVDRKPVLSNSDDALARADHQKCTYLSHLLTLRSQGTKVGCSTVCGKCDQEIRWEDLNPDGKALGS